MGPLVGVFFIMDIKGLFLHHFLYIGVFSNVNFFALWFFSWHGLIKFIKVSFTLWLFLLIHPGMLFDIFLKVFFTLKS